MSFLKLLTFLILIVSFEALKTEKALVNQVLENEVLVDPLHQVLMSNHFDNVVNFISVDTFKTRFLIKKLMKKVCEGSKLLVKLESVIKDKKKILGRKLDSVLIIESFENFTNILGQLKTENLKSDGKFLIVLANKEFNEAQEILKTLWNLQIYNVNLMFENENQEVLVKTFFPFNGSSCNDTAPILINTFKNGKFSKLISNFFPEKMKNLHNCLIKVVTSNQSTPYIIIKNRDNGTVEYVGAGMKLIQTLSEIFNFEIELILFGPEGFLHLNGSSGGSLKAMMDGQADLSVISWWLNSKRLKFFDASTPYFFDKIAFIIPPGVEFSSFEKLIFPFQVDSWIAIMIFYIVGVLTISFVKGKPKNVQNFVVGRGVKNSHMNMFNVFLGGSLKKLPRQNFGRFLLTMFLIYSLIIRVVYQASYYELLKSGKHHKEVQTLEEMIERNFKFYAHLEVADNLRGTNATAER